MSVVIVGGGLMGLSAAFHLRRTDPTVSVTVLERDRVGAAASGASAAGVRAMGRDPGERALALASLRRWPDLHRELEADVHYHRGGCLRLALDEPAWRAAGGWIAEQRAHGVPVEVVDAATARRLASGITPDSPGGVWCPIDGHADAMATVRAFASAARRIGARIEEGIGARALVTERGRMVAVERTDGLREPCETAIVTAGTWSAGLLTPLGVRLPLETRALQMLLTAPAPKTLAPVLGGFEQKLSLKQFDDGAYLIGGGWPARITDVAGNRYEMLDDSVKASLEVARLIYPRVGSYDLARSWAGLEAFTPDGVPVIGPVPDVKGLLVAAGFSGHGFALSPAVGDVLARVALRRDALETLWSGLRFDRPALASAVVA